MTWKRLLAFITGSVDEQLILHYGLSFTTFDYSNLRLNRRKFILVARRGWSWM
jgi:hypothetical protein